MKIYMLFSEAGWIGAYSSPEKATANAKRYMESRGGNWTENKSVKMTWFHEDLEQTVQVEDCELDEDCDVEGAVDIWHKSRRVGLSATHNVEFIEDEKKENSQ